VGCLVARQLYTTNIINHAPYKDRACFDTAARARPSLIGRRVPVPLTALARDWSPRRKRLRYEFIVEMAASSLNLSINRGPELVLCHYNVPASVDTCVYYVQCRF